MSDKMREAFEAEFPVPEHVEWSRDAGKYIAVNDFLSAKARADKQNARLEAWQAAQRQGGETVAWRVTGNFTDQLFRFHSSAKAACDGLLRGDPDGGYKITPLYTTPQPAVPELVEALEWYEEQVWDCRKTSGEGERARSALDKDGGERARNAMAKARLNHSQPQPDWTPCSEGEPTSDGNWLAYRPDAPFDSRVVTLWYDSKFNGWSGKYTVTHYRKRPEPPEVE